MKTLGHMTEMIPYWLNHCWTLIAATGTPPAFGRTPGSLERLAGVAHGASADPDALLRQLDEGSSDGGERDQAALHHRAR